jgi:hypothetical protein
VEWRDKQLYDFMHEYNFVYLDKFGLRIRMFGWRGKTETALWENPPFYEGQVTGRTYIYWDIFPIYKLCLHRRHSLSVGIGYTSRKGQEEFVSATNSFDAIFGSTDVNDKGIVGELCYSYDIGRNLVAGADVAYRSYDRGDPVITAGLKFGVVLRH